MYWAGSVSASNECSIAGVILSGYLGDLSTTAMRALILILLFAHTSFQLRGQAIYDARIEDYVGLRYACDGMVQPVLKIANNGTETMFGCVVETWKNGAFTSSFDWQLATPALEGQVRTPLIPEVPADPSDVLEFRIISVNGVADEVADGNILELLVVEPDEAAGPLVLVEIRTDDQPEETTWTIRDAGYEVVASGGPYSIPNTVEQTWVELQAFTCYQLEVIDASEDGITSGVASLSSTDQEAFTMDVASPFAIVQRGFITGDVLTIRSRGTTTAVRVFPVPSSEGVTLDLPPSLMAPVHMDLLDPAGRIVHTTTLFHTGTYNNLSLGHVGSGHYRLRCTDRVGNAAFGSVVVAH